MDRFAEIRVCGTMIKTIVVATDIDKEKNPDDWELQVYFSNSDMHFGKLTFSGKLNDELLERLSYNTEKKMYIYKIARQNAYIDFVEGSIRKFAVEVELARLLWTELQECGFEVER